MTNSDFGQQFGEYKIVLADEKQVAELEKIVEAMYDHFYESNSITQLPKNGFKNWSIGYGRSRSVSRTIFICYYQDKCVGMIEGQMKIGGAMSDLGRLGHITHLYVSPKHRKKGLASKLYRIQESWFLGKNVDNVTLEVVFGNELASAFWSSIGFRSSFYTMLKSIDDK